MPRRDRLATLLPAAVLLLTLASAGVAGSWLSTDAERTLRAELDFQARDAEARILERLQVHSLVLHGAGALFTAVDRVDPATFERFVATQDLDSHFRGDEGLAFAEFLPGASPRAPVELRAGALHPELLPRGFDAFTVPALREALDRAVRTGEPALASRVLLPDAGGATPTVALLAQAVFRGTGDAARGGRPRGWVLLPFTLDSLLRGIPGGDAGLQLHAGERPDPDTLLVATASPGAGTRPDGRFLAAERTFTFGGERWTLLARAPAPALGLGDPLRAFLLALGVVLGLAVTALVRTLATAGSRAQQAAREMNRDLLAAQDALRGSEDRLRRAARGGSVGLWDWEIPSGRVRYDETWAALLGHEPGGVDADVSAWEVLVHPDDLPAVHEAVEACLRGATPSFEVEHRLRHREGLWTWMLARGAVVERAPDGSPLHASGTHIEITDRKLAEEALREGERFLRTVLDTSLDGFWVVGPDGRLLDANPTYCTMSGFDRPTLLGLRAADLEAPEAGPLASTRLAEIREAGGGRFETVHRRRDASLLHVEVSVSFVGGRDGAMVWFLRDISERRRAEERLRQGEERYRALVDNLNAGVLVHAADTTVVLCNAKACFLLGLEAPHVEGRIAADPGWGFLREDGEPMPVEEYPAVRAFAAGEPVVNTVVGIRRPGRADVAWVLLNAHPGPQGPDRRPQVVVTFVDISRRREAEEALRQSQRQLAIAARMAAMGTLVAGVAHEINNPLAGTLAAQSSAEDDLRDVASALGGAGPDDRAATLKALDRAREAIEDAQVGARRVSRIVKDLTTFGRPDPRRARIPLADVVRAAMRWVPPSSTGSTRITVTDLGAPEVTASAGQIEQVVVNLLTNAAKAIPPDRVGNVEVTLGAGPDGAAWLTVSDDGVGMSSEMVQRVFDPFFTTRPVGQDRGTGLGLSICHAIVTAHGGSLGVRSEPGKGSIFRMDLPGPAAD